ncbi:hypothetical protein [Ideonella sp.]|uniref:hypothetical protein n=1 Tax=Ideonella sp. TaxID=1929293 RepID=UPI0035B126E8
MTASPATRLLFGERSLTVVAADFASRFDAHAAADQLRADRQADGPVAVLSPHARHVDKVLEPETRGIWSTALRSHLTLGLLGLAGGLAIGALLIAQWTAAAASPGFTLLFLGVMGLFSGGMWAGFITLRPDHGRVIRRVEDALHRHQWAVVVHPRTEQGARHAARALRGWGADPARSL